jgi:hypothetical protein
MPELPLPSSRLQRGINDVFGAGSPIAPALLEALRPPASRDASESEHFFPPYGASYGGYEHGGYEDTSYMLDGAYRVDPDARGPETPRYSQALQSYGRSSGSGSSYAPDETYGHDALGESEEERAPPGLGDDAEPKDGLAFELEVISEVATPAAAAAAGADGSGAGGDAPPTLVRLALSLRFASTELTGPQAQYYAERTNLVKERADLLKKCLLIDRNEERVAGHTSPRRYSEYAASTKRSTRRKDHKWESNTSAARRYAIDAKIRKLDIKIKGEEDKIEQHNSRRLKRRLGRSWRQRQRRSRSCAAAARQTERARRARRRAERTRRRRPRACRASANASAASPRARAPMSPTRAPTRMR